MDPLTLTLLALAAVALLRRPAIEDGLPVAEPNPQELPSSSTSADQSQREFEPIFAPAAAGGGGDFFGFLRGIVDGIVTLGRNVAAFIPAAVPIVGQAAAVLTVLPTAPMPDPGSTAAAVGAEAGAVIPSFEPSPTVAALAERGDPWAERTVERQQVSFERASRIEALVREVNSWEAPGPDGFTE